MLFSGLRSSSVVTISFRSSTVQSTTSYTSGTVGEKGDPLEAVVRVDFCGIWGNEQDDDEYIIILDECTLGQPKFFSESRLKLHGEVWAKTRLETNFQPFLKSFDHASKAPKVPR